MKWFLPKLQFKPRFHLHIQRLSVFLFILLFLTLAYNFYREGTTRSEKAILADEIKALRLQGENLKSEGENLRVVQETLQKELKVLKNEDTRKTNEQLKGKISQVEKTFKQVGATIENLGDARNQGINVASLEKDLAQAVDLLSKTSYEDADKKLKEVNGKITQLLEKKLGQISAPAAQDLPGAGSFRRQSVSTPRGNFVVSLVAEQASGVRMITDTANDDTCSDNCPTLPLANYVQRNGGFAGINGTYFCPADYPSCAGKVNSYNTLVFNARLKKYMNSDQNVYSTVAMVVQNSDRSFRFMGQSLEWGRDTGIIGGIANHPMLVVGGKSVVNEGGLDEKSRGIKTNRGFIAVKGGTLYIGVVHGATVGDSSQVLATLGVDQAINLDGGGSSALYYNGKYMVGPGRNLPNAVILAR